MKKILTLVLISFAVMLVTSCATQLTVREKEMKT